MKHPGRLAWSFFFFWIDQKLSNFVAYQWAKLSPFTDDNTQYSHITTRYTVTVDDRQGEVWTVRLTFDWLLDLLGLLRFLSLLLHFLLLTFLRSLSTYRSKASANILQVLQINILWSCILTYSEDFNAVESLNKHKCIYVLACITKICRVCDFSLHATYIAYGKTCYIYLDITMYGFLLQWISQCNVKSLCRICRT